MSFYHLSGSLGTCLSEKVFIVSDFPKGLCDSLSLPLGPDAELTGKVSYAGFA